MTCTDCGAILGEEQRKGAPCHKCGSRNRSLYVESPMSVSGTIAAVAGPASVRILGTVTKGRTDDDDAPGTFTVKFDEAPPGSSEATMRKHRLMALIAACEDLLEFSADDGEIALVCPRRLRRVMGVAKRNKEDLDSGAI